MDITVNRIAVIIRDHEVAVIHYYSLEPQILKEEECFDERVQTSVLLTKHKS